MKNLIKIQLLLIAIMGFFFFEAQAQIDPSPYLGSVTMNSGRTTVDWTIESAGGNDVVLKNSQGYVTEVRFNGNYYNADKNQAMKFIIDVGGHPSTRDCGLTLRDANNTDMCYTYKGGNLVMHGYMIDGSTWIIKKSNSPEIDPTPYLGDVTMDSGRTKVDWTIESCNGNSVVLKNNQGYVTEVRYNGNYYSADKSKAMRFVIAPGGQSSHVTVRAAGDPDMCYTYKVHGGIIAMHGYMNDGSNWTITKR